MPSMALNVERRSHKRHTYSSLSCSMWSNHDVQVMNISLGGILIRTNRRLTLNREYPFKLMYQGDSSPVSGVVKWCFLVGSKVLESGEQVPVYNAGLSILGQNAERVYKALQLTEEVCRVPATGKAPSPIEEPMTPTVLSELTGEHTVWVQMPMTFRVRTMSNTGMLIETDQPYRAESRLRMNFSLNDRLMDIVCRVTGQTGDTETGGFLMWLEFITIYEDGNCLLDCTSPQHSSAALSGQDAPR